MKEKLAKIPRKIKIISILIFVLLICLAFWINANYTPHRNISDLTLQGTNTTILEHFNNVGAEFGTSFTKITDYNSCGWDYLYAISKDFDKLTDQQKLSFFIALDLPIELSSGEYYRGEATSVDCHKYRYEITYDEHTGDSGLCSQYAELSVRKFSTFSVGEKSTLCELKVKDLDYYNGGSGSTKTTCPTCNGSGLIRYYYGDSPLEAFMDGQPDSTVQKCYTCGGTGYVNK